MCATVTYPLAVRVARKIFKLRGFYSIHLAIAPFLALAHVNIFGVWHMYFKIKHTELEYETLKPHLVREAEYQVWQRVHNLILKSDFRPRSSVTQPELL